MIAGDVCPIDGEYGDHTAKVQARWLKEVFNPWVEQLSTEQVFLIGGNHDAILDPIYGWGIHFELHPKITYLIDIGAGLGDAGPFVWGSPWIPQLAGWPFFKPAHQLREIAEAMPGGYDIWLLHCPPFSLGYQLDYTKHGDHAGNPFTAKRIHDLKPQLVVCGHIHEGAGVNFIGETNVANAAFTDQRYAVRWRHVEIDWNEDERSVERVEMVRDNPELGLWWDCREDPTASDG